VGFYDWMLVLHLLSVFAMASALVLFGFLVHTGRTLTSLGDMRRNFRLGGVGGILIGVGSVAALVFGVILAIDSDVFELWDGWVIAAIVLWAILGALGGRTGRYYTSAAKVAEADGSETEVTALLRAPTGLRLYYATVGLFLLLLLDMIFKPGA